MTWREFKKVIDEKLKEQGISEATGLWYVDIMLPDKDNLKLFEMSAKKIKIIN